MALTTPSTPTLPQAEIRQLEDRITEIAAHIHAANYRLLTLIRRFDEAAGWAEPDRDKPLPCPVEQRRADALERLSDALLSGDQGTVSGGDRCTLHVHTDVKTLRENGEGAESTLENGGNVSAVTPSR